MAEKNSVGAQARTVPATAVFALGAVLLLAATRILIPGLVSTYKLDPLLAWFLAAGVGVLFPLLLLG